MATLSSTISGFVRSDLAAETKVIAIPLTSIRKNADLAVNLPAAPDATNVGLVTGTPGTHAPTLQGTDPGGGVDPTEKFAFEFTLPPEYVDNGAVAIRVKGLTATTIASVSSTIDFNVYLDGRDGTVGADIMASAAFSINNTTAVSSDMTITASTLTAGSKIIVVGTMASVDVGDAGVMTPTIQALEMVLQVKG